MKRSHTGTTRVTPRALALAGLVAALAFPAPALGQSAEDRLGNWFIWNGTIRFSDRWSLFTESHLRLYELASNLEETFVRVAPQLHLGDQAALSLGFTYTARWPFEDADGTSETEARLYQQLSLKHNWNRSVIDHRYRVEQRWIRKDGQTDFLGRARYRIQVTTPFNRPALEAGAWFSNAYNEILVKLDGRPSFDQNRLYAAIGHHFTDLANLQVGYLFQSRSQSDFHRLQIFLTWNFDLR